MRSSVSPPSLNPKKKEVTDESFPLSNSNSSNFSPENSSNTINLYNSNNDRNSNRILPKLQRKDSDVSGYLGSVTGSISGTIDMDTLDYMATDSGHNEHKAVRFNVSKN